MKTVFYSFIIAILFIANIYSCTKDDADHQAGHDGYTFADVEQNPASQGKSGTYYPFNYPESQVTFHDFLFIYTIQNQNKLDSTVYTLHAKDLSFRYGIYWQVYDVIYFYKDGTMFKELVNAPISIGDKYVKLPNLDFNQLNIGNPENWVKLSKTKKSEKWISDWCGKELDKWAWILNTSSGINMAQTIDPSNCSGYPTLLQYSLIF